MRARQLVFTALLPVISVALGFVVGGVVIFLAGADPIAAYVALFQGAFTNPNALPETLVATIPYVFLGLGVALGFRAGLFNIGADGQYYVGALAGTFVGYSLHAPGVLLLPVTLLSAMAGGFLWAGIAGVLKATTGAHEVITTIMLNYIAYLLVNFLIDGYDGHKGWMLAPGVSTPRTPLVNPGAVLPVILGGSRLHAGLILAIVAVPVVWFLIDRTTIGFRLRAVGFNQGAARAAGMSVRQTIVLTMGLSGALAGLAGIVQIIGLDHNMTDTVAEGYGFNAITVALVARSNPLAVPLSALLFGALHAGASFMQLQTQVSSDLISIIQASVLVFVAAPALVRWIFRVREAPGVATIQITQREVEASGAE